jgi:hypothetical protein
MSTFRPENFVYRNAAQNYLSYHVITVKSIHEENAQDI